MHKSVVFIDQSWCTRRRIPPRLLLHSFWMRFKALRIESAAFCRHSEVLGCANKPNLTWHYCTRLYRHSWRGCALKAETRGRPAVCLHDAFSRVWLWVHWTSECAWEWVTLNECSSELRNRNLDLQSVIMKLFNVFYSRVKGEMVVRTLTPDTLSCVWFS